MAASVGHTRSMEPMEGISKEHDEGIRPNSTPPAVAVVMSGQTIEAERGAGPTGGSGEITAPDDGEPVG